MHTGFLKYRAVRADADVVLSEMLLAPGESFSGWPPVAGPDRIEGDFRVDVRALPDGEYKPILSYRDEADGWKIEPIG